MSNKEYRKPGLGLALLPIVLTLAILMLQLFYFGNFVPHIPLAIGIAITGLVALYLGHDWDSIEDGLFHVVKISLPSVSVLIVVGMIIGVWIASGTVPTLIYYGLLVLNPSIFLAAAMILCAGTRSHGEIQKASSRPLVMALICSNYPPAGSISV